MKKQEVERERKVATEQGQEKIDTEQLSRIFLVQPNTIRRNLCQKGHFLGLVPVKLPNGRLLWPADPAKRIANGEV